MPTLVLVADIMAMPMLIIGVVFGIFRLTAVKGSRQRYILNNAEVIFSAGYVLSSIVLCLDHLREGEYANAAWIMPGIIIVSWNIWRALQDDNWFNNQHKKLKRGLKKLRESLSNLSSPAPSPA